MVGEDTWSDFNLLKFLDMLCDLTCDLSWGLLHTEQWKKNGYSDALFGPNILFVSTKSIWSVSFKTTVSFCAFYLDDQPLI